MKKEILNFVIASFLTDAPIDKIGEWQVCWRGVDKIFLSSIAVEASLSDGHTERTILPSGCVLPLSENSADE